MLYRKPSHRPPKLLLRVVATAGTGAILSVMACSSESNGVIGNTPFENDAGQDGSTDADVEAAVSPCLGFCGVVVRPEMDAGDGGGPCADAVCGIAPIPGDAGEAGADAGGDAAKDADIADGSPPDGSDASLVECGGVCGIIVHLEE